MKFLKKYSHTWIIPIYGILYMLAFRYVEQRNVRPNIIHVALDDYIPFCEYFIIPYLLWFFYVVATVIYFSFINQNKKEYWQLICTLGIGMTLFIFISLIYPNGQNLRPNLTGDSMFNSVACCNAIFRHKEFKNHKIFLAGVWILTVLIILATVFLKQHTVVDVIAAFALNLVCYQFLYRSKAVTVKEPVRV